MELITKNVHMDRVKCKATTQITFEDDIIVSDSKPDIDKIIMDKGTIKIEEIKTGKDSATVKGRLHFCILYLAQGEEQTTYGIEGAIPFEEQIYMEGIEGGDNILLHKEIEDLTVGLINPRKLSVQGVVTLYTVVEEIFDVISGIGINADEFVECKKKEISVAEIAVQKKDIFRYRQDIELPNNLPNIFTILWEEIKTSEVEFKTIDGKITIQGEVEVFILYEGEGEEQPPRWYETVLPFSGNIECDGCNSGMVADIDYQIEHMCIEIKPDFDGEERVIAIDLAFDLMIKLYQETRMELLEDMYGITKEIKTIMEKGSFCNLLMRNYSKKKVEQRLRIMEHMPSIMQICHSSGMVQIDEIRVVPNGVEVEGSIMTKVLYITSVDKEPFSVVKGLVPFVHMIDAPEINQNCTYKVNCCIEQISTTIINSEEIDVKCIVGFQTIIFENMQEYVMTDFEESQLDPNKINALPSIVAYIVQEGDNLWNLGKKYYVPLDTIRETNQLSSELKRGDKIVVLK